MNEEQYREQLKEACCGCEDCEWCDGLIAVYCDKCTQNIVNAAYNFVSCGWTWDADEQDWRKTG